MTTGTRTRPNRPGSPAAAAVHSRQCSRGLPAMTRRAVSLRGLEQIVRHPRDHCRHRPRGRQREFVSVIGPVGVRQDDTAADRGRARSAQRRRGAGRRRAGDGGPPRKRVGDRAAAPGLLPVAHRSRQRAPAARRQRRGQRPDDQRPHGTAGTGRPRSFLDAHPHELSGGMQQRVALVRAFALGAPLLAMDEPFAALDEITRADMRGLLDQLVEGHGVTTLFVTHSITEAVVLCDRVLVTRPGPARIVADIADRPPPAAPERRRRRPGVLRSVHPGAARAAARAPTDEPGRPRTSPPVVGLVVFFAAWELLVRVFDVRPFVLAPPERDRAIHGAVSARLLPGGADHDEARRARLRDRVLVHSSIGCGDGRVAVRRICDPARC